MIERRPFGRTGHHSTVTLSGAAALAPVDQDAADRALEVLTALRDPARVSELGRTLLEASTTIGV